MSITSYKTGNISPSSLLVGNSAYIPPVTVDYLVIAGGGAGGCYSDGTENLSLGGGGAGGYRTSYSTTGGGGAAESQLSLIKGESYTVTIGAGGSLASGQEPGNPGNNSVFSTITSTGGGGGAPHNYVDSLSNGGSSGGAGHASSPGTRTASPVQGYNGGTGFNGTNPNRHSGGGGGAGGAGGNASSGVSGAAGAGLSSDITGSSVTRGTGGAGYGAGVNSGANGTANTGGGGKGGNRASNLGVGGSGVVIVRALQAAASTTGSPTYTTSGSYHIYQFTGSGSITY